MAKEDKPKFDLELREQPPPPPPPAPSPSTAPSGAVQKTPAEWAQSRCYLAGAAATAVPDGAIRVGPGAVALTFPPYAGADALHGWTIGAGQYQGEKAFKLTEADFDAAILAAACYPAVSPHLPAVAPGCPYNHEGFKPRGFANGESAQQNLDATRERLARQLARFKTSIPKRKVK